MKEHDLVTNPEISLKLKQIGCPQDTYFRWVRQMDEIKGELKYIDEYELYNSHDQFSPYICENDLEKDKSSFAAYMAKELLEILPKIIEENYLTILCREQKTLFDEMLCGACYMDNNKKIGASVGFYKQIEEALAQLILFLHEYDLIKFNKQGE